jgi:HCO3- transporter integral membrane domain
MVLCECECVRVSLCTATEKVIYSQMFGGLVFALFGGQPLIILLSTAPLALYIKVIYSISEANDFNFFSMYAWVGLWNAFFLLIYAFTEASVLMRFSTRSIEETFAFFISVAFAYDAIRPVVEYFLGMFKSNLNPNACQVHKGQQQHLVFCPVLIDTHTHTHTHTAANSPRLLAPCCTSQFFPHLLSSSPTSPLTASTLCRLLRLQRRLTTV